MKLMRTGSKQLLFFFTPEELASIIKTFEMQNAVSYYQTGLFSSTGALKIESLLELPSIGYLDKGDWNHSPSYLVLAKGNNAVSREIVLKKGGFSYAIDQQENYDTVIFKPSGIFTENILVAGRLVTGSTTTYSVKMFQAFAKIIKSNATRIGVFYVGPDAKSKLIDGWRLVTNADSPMEYDLVLDQRLEKAKVIQHM